MREESEYLSTKTALLRRRARDRSLVVRIQNHPGPARASKIDSVLGDRPVNAPNEVIGWWDISASGEEQTQGSEEKRAVHASYSPQDNVPASNAKMVGSGFESEVSKLDNSPSAWCTPAVDFRARLFLWSLTPARRAEIASRRRFHTIPFIRPANQPDTEDMLP